MDAGLPSLEPSDETLNRLGGFPFSSRAASTALLTDGCPTVLSVRETKTRSAHRLLLTEVSGSSNASADDFDRSTVSRLHRLVRGSHCGSVLRIVRKSSWYEALSNSFFGETVVDDGIVASKAVHMKRWHLCLL